MKPIKQFIFGRWESDFKFWSSERNTENTVSDLYFSEESNYFEQNTYNNKVLRCNILQPFYFEAEQKKTCGNEIREKETTYIQASAANLLHIWIGNLEWREVF